MYTGPLEDRIAIRELNEIYADGVVRIDPETWGSVWAEDAHWDLMGMKADGREAIVGFWTQAMTGFKAVSFHCVPSSIEIDGNSAKARCQTQEVMMTKEGKTRVIGGLYEDELEKRDGRWVFTSRVFKIVAEYNAEKE